MKISLDVYRSRVLSHVPMMPSLSLRLLVLTAPDRSSWALIGLERSFLCFQLFSSQELAANYHLFCACFGSFLLLRCFSCPLGLAASVSFASSSDASLVRGFPVFLVRDAWSVLAPGQPSCCVRLRSSVRLRSFSLCVGASLFLVMSCWRVLWFGLCLGARWCASPVALVG